MSKSWRPLLPPPPPSRARDIRQSRNPNTRPSPRALYVSLSLCQGLSTCSMGSMMLHPLEKAERSSTNKKYPADICASAAAHA